MGNCHKKTFALKTIESTPFIKSATSSHLPGLKRQATKNTMNIFIPIFSVFSCTSAPKQSIQSRLYLCRDGRRCRFCRRTTGLYSCICKESEDISCISFSVQTLDKNGDPYPFNGKFKSQSSTWTFGSQFPIRSKGRRWEIGLVN